MSYVKIIEDLPQGDFPQKEERLRKPFFVFLCTKKVFLGLSSLCGGRGFRGSTLRKS
jgi:hypothetical protein